MIWTDPADLPQIRTVANAIVDDALRSNLRFEGEYVAYAPTLFGSAALSVIAKNAPVTDVTAIEGGAGPFGISLSIGTRRAVAVSTDEVRIAVGGALCQELVHLKQRARDVVSYDMAVAVQKHWIASRPASTSPEEWLTGYFGTVYEFEAHAEQIAFEIWATDNIAGVPCRKSEKLAALTTSEPLRRIYARLRPAGATSSLADFWLKQVELKMNEALASW